MHRYAIRQRLDEERERTEPERVFIQVAIRQNLMKDLEEILAITRSVGWGASYLLRSYYDGDLKDTSLEIQTNRMALLLQILLSITTSSRDYKLIWAMTAYVSEETYKLQLAGQLSQPWVWIIDPLDGTRLY